MIFFRCAGRYRMWDVMGLLRQVAGFLFYKLPMHKVE